ncbi:MAG: RHS repeat-associated core domain-containing protein [Hyphomonadaceae bacterium]|nr:RHS repeat-associated core domain-containing protein [Hyphomonadaceae bacterium]
MIAETDAAGGAVRRRYVHGPGMDEPVVMYEYGSPSSFTRSWYLTDQKGSVTCLADSSGTSAAVNAYGYYGEPGADNHGRYQYTGQVWLEKLGLYYYKARFYDPGIKRFLNPDPAGYGDGLNMYAHVGGDPVNFRDPSGLRCTSVNTGRSFTDGNEFIVEGVRQCSGGSVRRRSSLGTNSRRGSFFGSSHAGFNPGGGRSSDVAPGEDRTEYGHDYKVRSVICKNASAVPLEARQAIFAWLLIPRPLGFLIDARTVAPDEPVSVPVALGFSAGYITSIIDEGGLSGTNTTVQRQHIFAGRVYRELREENGELVMYTRGFGTAGPVMDAINQFVGPKIFGGMMDGQAIDALARLDDSCRTGWAEL